MDCPVCRKPTIILEHEGVELDFCLECRGVWLDHGELALIVTGTLDTPEDWEIAAGRKSDRRCPRCFRRMRAGTLPGTSVEVDSCARGHGVWLDGGELEAIAKARATGDRRDRLTEFVTGVFGNRSDVKQGG